MKVFRKELGEKKCPKCWKNYEDKYKRNQGQSSYFDQIKEILSTEII